MEQEILQLIKEKLPAIQAEAIASFVKEAEDVKKTIAVLNVDLEYYRKTTRTAQDKVIEVSEQLQKYQNMDVREDNLKDAELKIAVDAQKLVGAEEKVALVKEMFRVVFANAHIKRQIFGQTPVKDATGYTEPGHFDKTETETQE